MKTEKKESYPLSWPDDWPRTRSQDQKPMGSWKRTASQYRDDVITELERMGSPMSVISSNVPLNMRGAMIPGMEPRDVGVAVYFSRKKEEEFAWQDVFNLHQPAPTEQEVHDAYRRLAAIYHPDKGGDITMFQSVTKHRDDALRWIKRETDQSFDYVIACDQFKEVRLNMSAIALTIKAIRQIERCGTSSLLERAFKGFAAIAAPGGAQ